MIEFIHSFVLLNINCLYYTDSLICKAACLSLHYIINVLFMYKYTYIKSVYLYSLVYTKENKMLFLLHNEAIFLRLRAKVIDNKDDSLKL